MDKTLLWNTLSDYNSIRKLEIVPLKIRRAKLRSFIKKLARSKTELYAALAEDLNRDTAETLLSELIPLLDIARVLERKLPSLLKPRRLPWSMATFPASAQLVREPYGRVLVVSTWNYPLLLALEPALGAYAAGNRVVLKLSPRAPHTNKFIRTILGGIFSSDEILIIENELSLSETLNFRYDYIFLTGSQTSGREALRAAAEHCTPATVELGGKNPCIVTPQANLKIAARRIVWGKFFNAGQSCAAPDYLLVHRDIKDKFMLLLSKEIQKQYGANPLDGGKFAAMPDRAAYDRICRLAANGRLRHGGDRDPDKLAFEPSIIDRLENDSELLTREVFGPVLPVMDYSCEAELLQILYKQEKPLALYCFGGTRKLKKILTAQISAGATVFNDVLIHFSNMHIPFGGVGASGFGAYHGIRTLTTFTHEKPVVRQFASLDFPVRYLPHSRFFRRILEFFSHVK